MAVRAERRGDALRIRTSDGIDLPWPYGEDALADLGADFSGAPDAPEGRLAQAPMVQVRDEFRMVPDAPSPPRMDPRELAARQGMEAGQHTGRHADQQGPGSGEQKARSGLAKDAKKFSAEAPSMGADERDRKAEELRARGGAALASTPAGRDVLDKSNGDLRAGAERENLDLNPQAGQGGGTVGGGGRPRLVKGGLRLEGFTRERGADPALQQETREAVGGAIRAEELALGAEAEQRMGAADFAAQQADDFIGAQKSRVDKIRRDAATAEGEIANHKAVLDHERQQLLEDEQAPRDFWGDTPTGAKILAAIGSIMAGIGNRDDPIKPIREAIQERKETLRQKLASRREGIGFINEKIAGLEKRLGTDLSLDEIEGRELMIAAAETERFGLKTGDPAIIARTNAEAAKMKAEALTKFAPVDRQMSDRIVESVRNVPDQVVGGQAAMKPEARERLVTFGNGQHRGFVVAGNARERVQQAVTGWENIADLASQMRAVAKDASAGNLDAQRKYNSLRSAYLAEVTVMRGQGAMSEGDQANAEQGAPDLAKLATTRNEAETRMKEQESIANARVRSTVRDNVYADPDATTPILRGSPKVQRGQE